MYVAVNMCCVTDYDVLDDMLLFSWQDPSKKKPATTPLDASARKKLKLAHTPSSAAQMVTHEAICAMAEKAAANLVAEQAAAAAKAAAAEAAAAKAAAAEAAAAKAAAKAATAKAAAAKAAAKAASTPPAAAPAPAPSAVQAAPSAVQAAPSAVAAAAKAAAAKAAAAKAAAAKAAAPATAPTPPAAAPAAAVQADPVQVTTAVGSFQSVSNPAAVIMPIELRIEYVIDIAEAYHNKLVKLDDAVMEQMYNFIISTVSNIKLLLLLVGCQHDVTIPAAKPSHPPRTAITCLQLQILPCMILTNASL